MIYSGYDSYLDSQWHTMDREEARIDAIQNAADSEIDDLADYMNDSHNSNKFTKLLNLFYSAYSANSTECMVEFNELAKKHLDPDSAQEFIDNGDATDEDLVKLTALGLKNGAEIYSIICDIICTEVEKSGNY